MGAEYIYVTILMTSIVSRITVSTNLNSKVDNQHFCSSCFCITRILGKKIFCLFHMKKKSPICLICCKSMLLCIVRKKNLASKWTWCILQSSASAYSADDPMGIEAKYFISLHLLSYTMRTNLPKTLDQLIFCKYTLHFEQIY